MKNKLIILIIILMNSCGPSGKSTEDERQPILLADREAPLGWVYLRIYEDKSFEFESRGLERKGDIYAGTIELNNDTIIFNYTDSIPRAGSKAILSEKYISYFDGEYPERVEIKMEQIDERMKTLHNIVQPTSLAINSQLVSCTKVVILTLGR